MEDLVPVLDEDYPEVHRLATFPPDYTPEALREEYNLAQAEALLYDATSLTVEATADFKHIVRSARLLRPLHRIERCGPEEYRLVFDGPHSLLRSTHAYGTDVAKFLAALVQARAWRLRAQILLRKGWPPFIFSLSRADGLRSRITAPALFDSQLKERFARKFGEVRAGWLLRREGTILEAGERLLVPDFVFTHEDGTEVAFEIVGYWTSQYLAEKFAKMAQVRAPSSRP